MPGAGAVFAVAASCAPQGAPLARAPAAAPSVTLESLAPGRVELGFLPVARFIDGEGHPRGARFTHVKTGFVLDYLAIETAPQAFVYVTTYPSSDRGEPHAQEHLVLGRGNKGRFLGNFEHTHLVRSSAFTAQYRTAYHFHSSSGEAAFFDVLHTELDALLHADYSDEEIRREVRDFRVSQGQDEKLFLEEQGTVYNEMVRSYEEPARLSWLALDRMIYGTGHPMALSSGGTPEGIRELKPEAIRRFYAAHYRLDNMGMVAAFPRRVLLDEALVRIGETLDAFAPNDPPPERLVREGDLPPPHGAPPGSTAQVLYPYASEDHPGSFLFGWPATRALDESERILMDLFMGAMAGGEGSRLFSALVDQKTRTLDVGATRVWSEVNREPGQVVYAGVESVRAASSDEGSLHKVRDLILAELRAVATLPDGSKELVAFGERVLARITEARRDLDKMLDTPPEFGVRGTYSAWIDLLTDVQEGNGFDKSLTRADALAYAETVARETKNPWRARIHDWGLDAVPYAVFSHPSMSLRRHLDEARAARVQAELARLESVYGKRDALEKRKEEVDAADLAISRSEATVPMPPLTRDPPMTDDDLLAWREQRVGNATVVTATVDSMKSATVGLALRLDTVPEPILPVVALLPSLIRDVGVVRDGVPIAYDEVRDRLRREVLNVAVYLSTSFSTGRAEIVFEASGNDVAEARRALGWVKDFLTSPDLRPENLPRIRDVIGQKAVELGDVMAGAEEHWVESVEEAYWRQGWPLLAHTGSFLTRAHDAHRLSWMLEGGGAKLASFLDALAAAGEGQSRVSLSKLARAMAFEGSSTEVPVVDPPLAGYLVAAHALSGEDRKKIVKAGRDLGRCLGEVPDASLASDWAALCREMAHDSGAARAGADTSEAPRAALAAVQEVLAKVRHTGNARAWIVSSRANEEALRPALEDLVAALDPTPLPDVAYPAGSHVLERARLRGARVADPGWVALVNPSTANAAFVASAALFPYDAPEDAAIDLFLATNVPSGLGAHSLYKRIWGAGLAYSGYSWSSARYGRYKIYSDRCADLASLLRFVDAGVHAMPAGPGIIEYAAARAFQSRAADTYEARARGLAVDLAEGFPPDRVRAFRERVLTARHRPGIAEAVHARIAPAYEVLLPTGKALDLAKTEGLHVIVGPEAQIAAAEHALGAEQGGEASIGRLYPRDFWYVGEVAPAHQ
jgi:Zn-dependent M16 (insulinase) family peptidase